MPRKRLPGGANRMPVNRLREVIKGKGRVLELKRSRAMESGRGITPKMALKTAASFLVKVTKRNPNNSTNFFLKIQGPKLPTSSKPSFAIFGFGGRNINREAFIQEIESILKDRDLADVKQKFNELTRYSIADLVELEGSPLLGSKGTAKVTVSKKKGVNDVVLVGAVVPSFNRTPEVVERNKRFLYGNLINNVKKVYGKNTVFTVRIPKADSRIASYLESKFFIKKTEEMVNVISLTIDLSKKFRRK